MQQTYLLIQAYDRIINISKKDSWHNTWQFQSTKKTYIATSLANNTIIRNIKSKIQILLINQQLST